MLKTMSATIAQKERKRILVMDNDQDMLTLLNRTLELEGYDAVVVGGVDEAMSFFKEMKPDMVIMNTFESIDDSVHALDMIREHSDTPVVVITADSKMDTLKTIFAHGADDFICMPFGVRLFIARIKAKLRRYNGEVLQPSN
jgi:two-component system response regulator MtrA